MATWLAWQQDPHRCDHLIFMAIEDRALQGRDLVTDHDQPDQHVLACRLRSAWPVLTPGWHTLHFDEPASDTVRTEGIKPPQRVSLMLAKGDIIALLPAMVAQVNAFYLTGSVPTQLLSRLHKWAAHGATAVASCGGQDITSALSKAGFQVTDHEDILQARYEPRYTAPLQAGGWWPAPVAASDHHAMVVGAGLAGASAAMALCRQGWRVTLIDQHAGPAQEASGNPGGLFHSIVHGDDGLHARAHRAGALATWRMVKDWIADGQLIGCADGLLRLDSDMQAHQADDQITRQNLPSDHVQWLTQAEAQARSGIKVSSGGWLFHQAGWLHPGGLVRLLLDQAGAWTSEGMALLTCLWQQPIDAIDQTEDGQWHVFKAGVRIASAPTLVLCNAQAASQLINTLAPECAVSPLPLIPSRGQITWLKQTVSNGVQVPKLPVAGSGYALPLQPDALLCGATTQPDDLDRSVRESDHRHNLRQAAQLGACSENSAASILLKDLLGRTAWRATTPDRLPAIGAMAWSESRLTGANQPKRLDQTRLIPRQRGDRGGLYVLAGLGSRGITWAGLAGELLAHWVTGTPCPIESDLRDALDPARFVVRQLIRKSQAEVATQT
ncbi:MAG: FAD-dependent 5-carboxymethylaminomethyl-2-thiouridine(34) oxidoreductase MnmC [Aquabacterium sp.]|nr:FAD-dependent 5-carboxymethylaminomethyl-2-thiouridine(34) oxidoreductase MnmC [Aquabacterium sp.]